MFDTRTLLLVGVGVLIGVFVVPMVRGAIASRGQSSS